MDKPTLRELRKRNKLTQIEVAKMFNISRRTYQKYETEENNKYNNSYQYIYDSLEKMCLIDEEHGILAVSFIKNTVDSVFKNYPINFCYLFGSYAKNKATDQSDVDLLIDSEVTGLKYFGLIEELRRALNKKVDLLNIDQIKNNEVLLSEILKDGIKIYG